MSDDRSFERLLAERMEAERGSTPLPVSFYDEFRRRASGTRQRPRWLALIKEPPMRYSRTLAVGSPTARGAAIVVAALLLALTLAGAGIAGARLLAANATIVVDQGGEGTVTTITDAVAQAAEGDLILVRPGTYDESVVLDDRDITIRGDGDREDVVVELTVEMPIGGTQNPPSLPAAFRFEGSDAVIENLTLRGLSSRVYIDGGGPVLRDLAFEGVGKVWKDNDPSAPSGLVIDNGSTAVIEGSIFVDTDIGIRSGSSPTLERNEITIGAIFMVEEARPIIEKNTIADSVKWGIAVWEGAQPEIVDNTIIDNLNGIVIEDEGSHPTLSDNTISGSTSTGISVGFGAGATMLGNTVCGNGTNLEVADGAEMPDTTGNEICEDASTGVAD